MSATLVPPCFVRTSAGDYSVGKLVALAGPDATVEYFLSPGDPPDRITVRTADLCRVHLDAETRAYYLAPATQTWRAGRVRFPVASGYLVRFPNSVDLELSETELFVRADWPIDPARYLASRVCESPLVHAWRSDFVSALSEQRTAAAGMSGLLSSVIELEAHQIEVVRRVLQDPVQRYLLADEVGLGKTIEAGIIIRQYVLDHPTHHNVLVVVPVHMKRQWELELADKFQLATQIKDGSLRIVGHHDAGGLSRRLRDAGLLVIDEAHQLAGMVSEPLGSPRRKPFDLIRECVSRPEVRLLLLSATPTLHNDAAGFQALLHLLDPVLHPLGDLEAFQTRLQSHQTVAELFHQFAPHETGSHLEACLDQFLDLFPADVRLHELAEQLRPHLAFGEPENSEPRLSRIQLVRTHVSEAYRLHRRLLRNRRADQRIQGVLPGRCWGRRLLFPYPGFEAVAAALDDWRVLAAGQTDGEEETRMRGRCHRLFLEALGSDLATLAALAGSRLGEGQPPQWLFHAESAALSGARPFPGEDETLTRLRDMALQSEGDFRIEALERYLAAAPDQRAVVFFNFPDAADRAFNRLFTRFGPEVVRHGRPGWHVFRTDPTCRVVVCDRRAEEGLNLQGGEAVLVHADLPFSPNRVEQRIGRVDRYGVGRPAASTVLLAQEDAHARVWCSCLNQAWKVFDRSVASLQYFNETEMQTLELALFHDGPQALNAALERLGEAAGVLETTLHEIRIIDELDAIERSELQEKFIEYLQEMENTRQSSWRDAFQGWVVQHLQFGSQVVTAPQDHVRRYQFRRPPRGGQQTLLPVRTLLDRFRQALDEVESAKSPLEPITYPLTHFRRHAQLRHTALARIGDPFIDALANSLRTDDRGACFAMWRHRPGGPEVGFAVFFRFHFVVEASLAPAEALLAGSTSHTMQALWRQANQWFPPLHSAFWQDENGEIVSDKECLKRLEEPYRDIHVPGFGRDYNLNPERWETIAPHVPAGPWADQVQCATEAARQRLVARLSQDTDNAARIEAACEEANERAARIASRVAFLTGTERTVEEKNAELDRQINEALLKGMQLPEVRLDSVGAVFLSDWSPFEVE